MDIAALSMSMSMEKLNTGLELTMIKKTMDTAETTAVEMLKMLPPSPYSFDVRA